MPAASGVNSEAGGVWTLRDAERFKRAGTWPIAPAVPGTPTSLVASGGNAQASLSWAAPASNGGTAITDYAVQFSSNGGATWTTFADGTSTATSATVTGLTNGTAYVFRVAAANAVGTGEYTSASSSVTPNATPTVTGGTITTPGDGYRYHTFRSDGTLSIVGNSLTCDVLVVGGGAGGRTGTGGGGGGGGGVLYQPTQIIAEGSYAVTVATIAAVNTSGGSSSIGSIFSASGGNRASGSYAYESGGSSGLPTSTSSSVPNSGGTGFPGDEDTVGGGGGGAGGVGGNAPSRGVRGAGGAGRTVFGTTSGAGGVGGLENTSTVFNGAANTGNGGSGGEFFQNTSGVGTGGSGIVVVRYLAP